jgi:biopolymer transport protein ExbD
MLASWRKSSLSTVNHGTFSLSMAVVVFVAVICEMTFPQRYHCGVTTDLPLVNSPVPMPHAMREDAMIITVSRSGDVVFGNQLVRIETMPELIREKLARGSERRVYIRADARTHYGNVKQVVDALRAAGLVEISLLTEQRRP